MLTWQRVVTLTSFYLLCPGLFFSGVAICHTYRSSLSFFSSQKFLCLRCSRKIIEPKMKKKTTLRWYQEHCITFLCVLINDPWQSYSPTESDKKLMSPGRPRARYNTKITNGSRQVDKLLMFSLRLFCSLI